MDIYNYEILSLQVVTFMVIYNYKIIIHYILISDYKNVSLAGWERLVLIKNNHNKCIHLDFKKSHDLFWISFRWKAWGHMQIQGLLCPHWRQKRDKCQGKCLMQLTIMLYQVNQLIIFLFCIKNKVVKYI